MNENAPYQQPVEGEQGGVLTQLQGLYIKMHYLIYKYLDGVITRDEFEENIKILEKNLFKARESKN